MSLIPPLFSVQYIDGLIEPAKFGKLDGNIHLTEFQQTCAGLQVWNLSLAQNTMYAYIQLGCPQQEIPAQLHN